LAQEKKPKQCCAPNQAVKEKGKKVSRTVFPSGSFKRGEEIFGCAAKWRKRKGRKKNQTQKPIFNSKGQVAREKIFGFSGNEKEKKAQIRLHRKKGERGEIYSVILIGK